MPLLPKGQYPPTSLPTNKIPANINDKSKGIAVLSIQPKLAIFANHRIKIVKIIASRKINPSSLYK